MRTLVTGGAGFIGTHLVRALVERGDEVVVLDSLEPQVHGDTQPDLPAGVELIVGNVGDRDLAIARPRGRRARRAPRRRRRRRPVDVRDRPLHRAQHDGHRALPRVRRRPAPDARARLVVASSMSIYGEGEYVCEEHGSVAPRPAPRGAAARARVGAAVPDVRRASCMPIGTSEAKPLIPTSIYAINKRDHEEMCLVTGAAYGIPDGRAALLQRLRPRPGALEPVHGRRGDLRLAPAERPPAGHLRGRRAVARLHARLATSSRASCSRSSPRRPSATPSTSAPAARPPSREVAQVISAGMGLDIEPSVDQQYRAGDIRHCFADPTRAARVLGFEAARPSRTGWASWSTGSGPGRR